MPDLHHNICRVFGLFPGQAPFTGEGQNDCSSATPIPNSDIALRINWDKHLCRCPLAGSQRTSASTCASEAEVPRLSRVALKFLCRFAHGSTPTVCCGTRCLPRGSLRYVTL